MKVMIKSQGVVGACFQNVGAWKALLHKGRMYQAVT